LSIGFAPSSARATAFFALAFTGGVFFGTRFFAAGFLGAAVVFVGFSGAGPALPRGAAWSAEVFELPAMLTRFAFFGIAIVSSYTLQRYIMPPQ